MYVVIKNNRVVVERKEKRQEALVSADFLSENAPSAIFTVAKELKKYWQETIPARRSKKEDDL